MSDVSLEIPRRLNDPPRMFWWDLDVALLVLAAALIGMISGFFISGCALGMLLASAYGGAKSGKHPAFALHLLYWHLPAALTGLKRTPPSHLREMLG
ncbi:MAG: type IV conjugative transfer system protein TraL [Burkholderiales bacterium]|nr:type IV conjugative transfer system protein TraL [Burkholderiales bacterium]